MPISKCLKLTGVAMLLVIGSAPGNAFARLGASVATRTVELFVEVRVICEQRKEAKGTRTFFCEDGQTCVNQAGAWKCRSAAAPLPMSCAVCASNQKRDSDACTRSGDLIQQNQCVNRVNAEYLKCIPGCR